MAPTPASSAPLCMVTARKPPMMSGEQCHTSAALKALDGRLEHIEYPLGWEGELGVTAGYRQQSPSPL